MPMHRLTSITMGVPNVRETAEYYLDFGLLPTKDEVFSAYSGEQLTDASEYRFGTVDGGEQLRLVHSPRRRLLQLGVGVEDPDDLGRIAAQLQRLDLPVKRDESSVTSEDPGTEVRVVVEIAPRYEQTPTPWPATNTPGSAGRVGERAAGVLREGAVHPRKLGHVVIGSTDQESSTRFFTEGLGFKVSDRVPFLASFMRCSTDHHNVLVQQAPVTYLHHSSWQVDDVDEIGRGATAMLAKDPHRHVWGLGRHFVGSNYFWYLRDPAGNFSEYYSDIDCIVDDQLWTPGDWEGDAGLYKWGPPPPPSFLAPEDLAGLMAGAHSSE
jgi:catechol 2,3-dioxygenase-like lactoylglutathione lyase family enzyme